MITKGRTLITAAALVLALAAAGCRDSESDVTPNDPAPYVHTTEPQLPDNGSENVPEPDWGEPAPDLPDEPETIPEPEPNDDPPTDPCAYPGDPLCPDTPITVPGPHLPQ